MAGVLGEMVVLRGSLQAVMPVVWLTLVGLVGCTLWTLAGLPTRGRQVPGARSVALLTIGFAVLWVLVDKHLEGPVLYALSDQHGVTASDLASVAAILVAVWRLLRP
jgi:hypothetical protein